MVDVPSGGSTSAQPRDRVLLVEGAFDLNFFRRLLLAHERTRVHAESFGGITRLRREVLTRSREPGFRNIRWLGIAVDGDLNPVGRYKSIRDTIRLIETVRFAIPAESWAPVSGVIEGPRAAIFVFPDGKREGDIETFLRETVADLPAASCVDEFIGCLDAKTISPRSPSKAWLYAFMASLAEPGQTLSAASRSGDLPLDLPGYQRLLDLIPADDEEI